MHKLHVKPGQGSLTSFSQQTDVGQPFSVGTVSPVITYIRT